MKATLENIDKVIGTKQYPYFRLLDENRSVIVPNKRPYKKDSVEYFKHWNFIKHKLVNELPAGKYILECFYDVGRKTAYDYTIIKSENDTNIEPVILQASNNLNDSKNNTTMTEQQIFDLVRECEQLKAEKSVLMLEVKMWQEKYAELESELEEVEGLADDSSSGMGGGIAAVMPTITPMLEKYFEQRDRELNLMEKRLEKQRPKPTIKISRFVAPQEQQQEQRQEQQRQEQPSEYQILVQQLNDLLDNDPDTANLQLDAIQDNNPDVYNQLVIDLNLESDE